MTVLAWALALVTRPCMTHGRMLWSRAWSVRHPRSVSLIGEVRAPSYYAPNCGDLVWNIRDEPPPWYTYLTCHIPMDGEYFNHTLPGPKITTGQHSISMKTTRRSGQRQCRAASMSRHGASPANATLIMYIVQQNLDHPRQRSHDRWHKQSSSAICGNEPTIDLPRTPGLQVTILPSSIIRTLYNCRYINYTVYYMYKLYVQTSPISEHCSTINRGFFAADCRSALHA